jgi:hypothetical protein
MAEFGTNERVLRSDVSLEECRKIEKVLRKNNISYFERWKFHSGLLKFLDNKNSKCDIYIHADSYEKAEQLLGKNA